MTLLLLTGASGLVGSAAAPLLAERGFRVRALVHRGPAPPGTEPREGDLADEGSLRDALSGAEVVVHAAARMALDPAGLRRINVEGTSRMARLAARAGVRRFVLLSTSAVYAPGPLRDATEESPTRPADAYGRSKLLSERAARAALGTRATILRPVTVYRTGACPFLATLEAILRGGEIPLLGAGDAPIDLVHADDLAEAIGAAAEGRGAGGTFNVAGPSPAPLRRLVEVAARALGIEPRWVPVPPGSPRDPRFPAPVWEVATVPRTVSIAGAMRELGYAPRREWEEEIARALRRPA